MKIIFTTDTIHRGGKERQLFILTRFLLDKGLKVIIITRHFSKENYLTEYRLEKEMFYKYGEKTWIKEYNLFKKIVTHENPDILMSWDIQTSFFSLLLHNKHNFIFINASIQHGIRLLRLSHILRSVICILSPYVIANSFAGLRANNLKPGKRRFVLYNGIENKFRNRLTKTDREIQLNKLIPGYSEKPGTIYISVANLLPYKDYFTVLKALNFLKDHSSFYYIIVGDGPMYKQIVTVIKEFGLEKRVIMTGKIENVSDYLFISDIMIHSTRGEGISNAILEGMYAGLPIIASNVGGIPETIFSGSSLMFPYRDNRALLECLIKAPEIFASFNKDSEEYRKYLAKFSVDTMTKKFEEIIINRIKEIADRGFQVKEY